MIELHKTSLACSLTENLFAVYGKRKLNGNRYAKEDC